MPGLSDTVDLLQAQDPSQAFWDAHRQGLTIALRTSGTSGAPRAVVRTTASWVDSFEPYSELTGIGPQARVWIPGPLAATMNLFATVQAESAGAHVVSQVTDASHVVLTPLMLLRTLESESLAPGVVAIVSGDAINAALVRACVDAGVVLHHYYGASELSFVAWSAAESGLTPFPGVDCQIEDGVIWARSSFLSLGYADGHRDGPLQWRDDGFATVGDHGEWRDGFLVVHGRGDAGITTAGVTVVVADVESALRPAARGSLFVVGLPDDRLGAVVCGIVTDPEDIPRLRARAAEQLDAPSRPRRWYSVAEVPLTPAGKPDRGRLAALVIEGSQEQVGR